MFITNVRNLSKFFSYKCANSKYKYTVYLHNLHIYNMFSINKSEMWMQEKIAFISKKRHAHTHTHKPIEEQLMDVAATTYIFTTNV